jgi:tryptophan synthase alpha chain
LNRLDSIFASGRKVLIAYLCVGDPSVDESVHLAQACLGAGADAIELGVPFSDPTADGPAIARASHRAIARGGGLEATLRTARALRGTHPQAGLVLFGYYNPLFVRGEELAAREAAGSGIDAMLVVDLPVEEGGSLRKAARDQGIGIVPLLAPTSHADRVTAVINAATECPTPFVYYVSVTGVTGSRALNATEAGTRAGDLAIRTGRPVVVGFGIDSREKARAAARHATGVVVGSALVRAVEQGPTAAARQTAVIDLVRELRAGIDEAAG